MKTLRIEGRPRAGDHDTSRPGVDPPGDPGDGQVGVPVELLARLTVALESIAGDRQPVPRLALRAEEAAEALGVSTRTLQRLIASRQFPRPTRHAGSVPLWSADVVRKWAEGRSP